MEQFMKELEELCLKHGLTIDWDEYREEFCVVRIEHDKHNNLSWLLKAYDNTEKGD